MQLHGTWKLSQLTSSSVFPQIWGDTLYIWRVSLWELHAEIMEKNVPIYEWVYGRKTGWFSLISEFPNKILWMMKYQHCLFWDSVQNHLIAYHISFSLLELSSEEMALYFFGVHLLKAENNLLKAETLFYKVMDFRQSFRLHEIGFLRL